MRRLKFDARVQANGFEVGGEDKLFVYISVQQVQTRLGQAPGSTVFES